MSLVLQQTLRGLCHNTPWSYAVFWKLKERARIVLTWEDGFYDYAKRNQAPAGEGDEVDTELLGLAVAKMSYHVYSYGEGIIGKIAFSGKHQWVFMGASVNTDEKHPVGWENQFMAGIKTIAVIAVPQGVVQLGSIKVVQEDLALVNHVRGLFTTLRSIPGAFLSDLMAEGPGGAQFNLAAFQTPQWPPPARPQTRPPQPTLSSVPEGPVAPTLRPNSSQFFARPPPAGPLPAQSPRGGAGGRPPYPPIAPRGAWVQTNSQMGAGFYTQVTPQLVAEGSPYGVPHPYGVPITAPLYRNSPTPTDGGGSQGGFSVGGMGRSQRKGRRMGGETGSSGGSRGGGSQAGSEARSSDSTQPQIQRQLSTGRKEFGLGGGLELRGVEGEGASITPSSLPNSQFEFARRLSPPAEMATYPVHPGGVPLQPRPSASYLRHSVGSLPDRYQTLLMGPHHMGGQPSPPSGRLSLLAPNPIQVHQARVESAPQPMLEKGAYFRTYLSKGHVSEKEGSPGGDTGCSTVSNVQPDVYRPPLDTRSEGASTVGDSEFPGLAKLPEPGYDQSKFSGGSSSLSTQVSAPAPELGKRLPALPNLRVSTGFSKMLSEGQKPTVETVEAYRMQQQAQLESLEKAGLKGTEVYNMWEEIMKENYRVGLALAGFNGEQDMLEIEPVSVEAAPAFPPSTLPNLDTIHSTIPLLSRQRPGSLQGIPRGGPVQAVSETPLSSCGATEQIQNMHLRSGSRSPDPQEVKSDRVDQPEPRIPEGVPGGRISRLPLRGAGISQREALTGAETILELAAMYSHTPFLAAVNPGSNDELGAEGIYRGAANVGLSRMMPTPGLSPTPTDLDLPASETPSPTVDPAFPAPAEAFKPRSSPPVPLFFANARTPSPSGGGRPGVPLFNNETIASLPTSSVWAIALKGSGEAAARRRAGLAPSSEPSMSHQGSAATQPMSYSMQACASSDVQASLPSTPSAVPVTSALDVTPPSDAESPRSRSPEPGQMTVMSAGAALESRGGSREFADSPGSRLEHAISAPAGWDTPSVSDVSKRTASKRKGDEFDDRTEASDATGEGAGESERSGARGRKKGRLRAPPDTFSPHELTSTGRPRPKDRQQIQRRLAELRGLVPNTGKLPIDGLLERTIKHLEFLQCVKSEKPVKKEVSLPPLLPLLKLDEPKSAPEALPGSSANPRKRPALRGSSSLQNPEINAKIRPERPAFSEASALNPPSLKPSDSTLNLLGNPPQSPELNLSVLANPHLFPSLQQSLGEPLRGEGPVDTWTRQQAPGGGAGLGRKSSVEQLLSSLHSEPVVVEVLKDPRQLLIEVLCKDESFFAELSGFLHGLGLQVKRSVLQTVANGQQWARFVVETVKPMDRLEVSIPLRRFIESKTGGIEGQLESRVGETGGSGTQLSLLPPLDLDFGAHFPTTHWQGLEGVLEHDLNMYLDDPY